MRLGLACLLLGAFPAPGQVDSTAVYTAFQQEPPPEVLDSMRREVAAIMSPGGLRLNWRSLSGVDGTEVFSELAVAKFQGNCDGSGGVPGHNEPGALAWSHVSEGAVIPFADVDCDRIQSFLWKKLVALESRKRETVFGRAVGRVLAHELYHIFARATTHGTRDVDKPYYTVAALLADDFGSDDSREHILRLSGPAAPAVRNKAPVTRDTPGRASSHPGLTAYVKSGCSACHGSRGQGTRHAPALRALGEAGDWLNSVMLAAKLERHGPAMRKRARELRLPFPSLAEADIRDVVQFLNGAEQYAEMPVQAESVSAGPNRDPIR